MHTTPTAATNHQDRTRTRLAVVTLGVIVIIGALVATDEVRTDSSVTPGVRPSTVAPAPAAPTAQAPSLLEGDPQAFDHAVAAAATALGGIGTPGPDTEPLRTPGAPSLLEGDHGLFEAAIADEVVEAGLER